MIRLTAEETYPLEGNIFDEDKLLSTVDAINNTEKRVKFNAPYAHITFVDIQNIVETLEAESLGELEYDYAIDRYHILTTGDDDLDKYLLDPEEYIEDETRSFDEEEVEEFRKEMEDKKRQAIEEQWGDIGKIHAQIRDGNHRRVIAFLSGEPDIWVRVSDNHPVPNEIKQYLH